VGYDLEFSPGCMRAIGAGSSPGARRGARGFAALHSCVSCLAPNWPAASATSGASEGDAGSGGVFRAERAPSSDASRVRAWRGRGASDGSRAGARTCTESSGHPAARERARRSSCPSRRSAGAPTTHPRSPSLRGCTGSRGGGAVFPVLLLQRRQRRLPSETHRRIRAGS
jgi:hypothetical protein